MTNTAPAYAGPSEKIGRYRWVVVGLLFVAMIVNYVDRQMIGVLKGPLSTEFGWNDGDFADLVFYFQLSYAVSYLVFGRLIDKIGARVGFGVAYGIWQVAHTAHAFATGFGGFVAARMALGIGEGGAFPAGIKAVAEWFPKKERAFATGIFNAGTNIGAILTPLIVPAIALGFGTIEDPAWELAFLIIGGAGLLLLPVWFIVYRKPRDHKKVTPAELAHIEQDAADPAVKVGWGQVIAKRETWAFAIGKFLTDPIWWMFLFWLPDFLGKEHGLDLKTFGIPLVAIYLLSDVGSVAGGWLSSQFIKRGWTINRARKTALFICALLALPVMFAADVGNNLWLAVVIIGIATAAHQGFSANLFTLPSDVFPRAAVGAVVGIGGMLGAVGGMAFSRYIGQVLTDLGTYTPIFIVAGCAYLVALLVIHLLMPRTTPVEIDEGYRIGARTGLFALIGAAGGAALAYVVRPATELGVQAGLADIVNSGRALRGVDQALAAAARTSFDLLLAGLLVGLALGIVLDIMLQKKPAKLAAA